MGHGSEIQIEVGKNLNNITLYFKGKEYRYYLKNNLSVAALMEKYMYF